MLNRLMMSVNLVGSIKAMDDACVEQLMIHKKHALNPDEVFPELVWLQISSKIQDTPDWLNFYFASSKLMDLLENEMYERIFPQVFSHLRKYLRRWDVINMCAADKKFESAILSWVQMRHLEPGWAWDRNDFDDYCNCIFDEMTPAYSPIVFVQRPKEIERITTELLYKSGPEFMIPYGIVFDQYGRAYKFRKAIKDFLRRFGHRIWLCKLRFIEKDSSVIIQLLKLIPNVVRLELDLSYVHEAMNHSLKFPHLMKLKALKMYYEKPVNFTDFLRIHADQLEILCIIGNHNVEETFCYSSLNKLRIQKLEGMSSSPIRFDQFSSSPMLKKIRTEIYAPGGFSDLGRRFLPLNMFGSSLEELELSLKLNVETSEFYEMVENDLTWTFNISLPRLKKLIFWSSGDGERFLLSMPSSFHDNSICRDFIRLNIYYRMGGEKLMEIFDSGIWCTLPNLEKIQFRRHFAEKKTETYTRDEYNEYHKMILLL